MLEPLREQVFRRIWLGSLMSNLGQMIQGVGAAWAMTQLTNAPDTVALVQTATLLPAMLGSILAGAIADTYDRRVIAMRGLMFALVSAAGLSAITLAGLLTPAWLLAFCFLVGTGVAIFTPAWQSSVGEQVPADALPAAVALNSISFNVARSFGPAVGGIIVATAGTIAAFIANGLLYLPLLIILALWRRPQEPCSLPPEALGRAIISGMRFALHSPPIRIVLVRTLLTGIVGVALLALMPLVTSELLDGGARTYGVLLGMFGIGAVAGALNIATLRRRFGEEWMIRGCSAVVGLALIAVSLSRSAVVTGLVLACAGAGWMVALAQFNISVQIVAPRWVVGRALATWQTSITGGMAAGAWFWGLLAAKQGVSPALIIAGTALIVAPLLGLLLPMPIGEDAGSDGADALDDPEIRLRMSGRDGPIIVQIEYRIDASDVHEFLALMTAVQGIRHRSGAFAWSIARDLADPATWIERFQTRTWHDYLRARNRTTRAERAVQIHAAELHRGSEPIRISRLLERPVDSLRSGSPPAESDGRAATR